MPSAIMMSPPSSCDSVEIQCLSVSALSSKLFTSDMHDLNLLSTDLRFSSRSSRMKA